MSKSVVITDDEVHAIVCTALEDRIVGLEMTAVTSEVIGDIRGQQQTLREWARARAALRLIKKGT